MHIKNTFRYVLSSVIILFSLTSLSLGQTKQITPDLKVGNLKIRKLQDAQIYLNIKLVSGIKYDEAKRLAGGDSVATPVNAYLIQTPNHLVLVDTGIGKSPNPNTGHLTEQLKEAGVTPSDIDLILITHFHFDHIGGLTTPDGKKAFPNAVVRASKKESEFWLRDASLIPEKMRGRAAKIKAVLAPYISTNSFKPFVPEADLGDGIKALPAYGHTIGHTVYTFSSEGKNFWCIGDLIHFGSVQFTHPKVSVAFDYNSQMAIASRLEFFKLAAESHAIVAGAHLPEMVKLKINGDGFTAIPVSQ